MTLTLDRVSLRRGDQADLLTAGEQLDRQGGLPEDVFQTGHFRISKV
jgi:hypothetical protein